MTIQENLNTTVCRISENLPEYRAFADAYPNTSPALCQALADASNLRAEVLAMKTADEIAALASQYLGLSRIHSMLIQLFDMYTVYGGLDYLDVNLQRLEAAGPALVRFWFVLEALLEPQWDAIERAVHQIRSVPACQRAWIQSAVAASHHLPKQYYLAGQAVVECLTRDVGECRSNAILAAHRATIEIIAASSGATLSLNYLGLFGFSAIKQLLAIPLCEPGMS